MRPTRPLTSIRFSIPLAVLAVLAAAGSAVGQIRTEESKFTPVGASSGAGFGEEVAMSGNRILGALRGRRDPLSGYPIGGHPGRVLLLDAVTGQRLAVLTASDGFPRDFFGSSVAADGQLGLVGAALANGVQSGSGAAYVFDLQGMQEIAKLTATDGQTGDEFGSHVAIDGTQVLVGAYRDADNGPNSGSAYLLDAITGQQQFKLKPQAGAQEEYFGLSVALKGSIAAVSRAYWNQQGAVYLFDSGTGQELTTLTAPNPQDGELFGVSVAIHGSKVLVGAPRAWDSSCTLGTCLGSVYIFDAGTGQQVGTLSPPAQSAALGFGTRLSVENGRVAVAAAGANTSGYQNSSVMIYDIASGQLLVELIQSDAPVIDPFDFLGYGTDGFSRSLAYAGGRVAVGAPRDDDNGVDAGAVYLFDDSPVNTGQGSCYADLGNPTCPCDIVPNGSAGCTNSTQVGAILYGDGDASINNDSLTLNVAYAPASVPGIFFQGAGQSPTIMGDGLLCSNSSLRYSVQVTDADGSLSRTGFSANTVAGAVLTYQFWYRDPANSCGGGFNFTNAWTVNW